jgi:hypothetical protein
MKGIDDAVTFIQHGISPTFERQRFCGGIASIWKKNIWKSFLGRSHLNKCHLNKSHRCKASRAVIISFQMVLELLLSEHESFWTYIIWTNVIWKNVIIANDKYSWISWMSFDVNVVTWREWRECHLNKCHLNKCHIGNDIICKFCKLV